LDKKKGRHLGQFNIPRTKNERGQVLGSKDYGVGHMLSRPEEAASATPGWR